MLKAKFDMVAMLGDIEIAQTLQEDEPTSDMHPTDAKYAQLCAKLKLMDKKSATYKVIEQVWTPLPPVCAPVCVYVPPSRLTQRRHEPPPSDLPCRAGGGLDTSLALLP